MNANRETLVVKVTTTWTATGEPIDRREIFTLLRDYLESEEHSFRHDYGPDAWGGYDGPIVVEVHVEEIKQSDVYENVTYADEKLEISSFGGGIYFGRRIEP